MVIGGPAHAFGHCAAAQALDGGELDRPGDLGSSWLAARPSREAGQNGQQKLPWSKPSQTATELKHTDSGPLSRAGRQSADRLTPTTDRGLDAWPRVSMRRPVTDWQDPSDLRLLT